METIRLRDDGSVVDDGPLAVDGADRAHSSGQQLQKLVLVADGSEQRALQGRWCGGTREPWHASMEEGGHVG